jgi:hypothetical protein
MLAQADSALADPKIVGSARDGRCREALHLADAAFRSNSGSLLWPIARPSRHTKIVLRQNARDISGGNALDVDPTEFSILRQPFTKDQEVSTFWAMRLSASKRLVVVDKPSNWRGDWYSVYLVDADLTPVQFAEQRNGEHSTLRLPFGDNRWNPPIVLQDAQSSEYWLIDRGEPYEVMAEWKVYTPIGTDLAMPCHISFGYSASESVERQLPSVRKLAAALDEALGPGTGEGTLQQTAGIRGEVAKGWANTTLRPWALTDEPYNSRVDVERGLAAWARGNTQRTALLRRIKASYPAAERELASYYTHRLRALARPPMQQARNTLDYMYRSYFVFSKTSRGT